MNSISFRHQLIKIANFLQSENTKIFADKFTDKESSEVKTLADRAHSLFGTWKDYDAYRNLLSSITSWEEMESFISKAEQSFNSISLKISELGIPKNVAEDMGRQYLHRYIADLNNSIFLDRVFSVQTKEEFISLLRGEKKKEETIPELKEKDLTGMGKEYILWITKIIKDSQSGGESHSIDDIISLAKTFKRIENTVNKKINEFSSYSELSRFIDDQSFDNKAAYISSIKDAATSDDMSKIIYEDQRWKVVLIGSTIAGQWWGRDTNFCISSLENNLYNTYALSRNIDPYFIIDKMANSSDKMRKFTLAIEYKDGKPKISNSNATMTTADNIAISFDEIKNYLGKDAPNIIESIMNYANTKSNSLGSENNKKIINFIEKFDEEQIIKYEKEIVANKNLIQFLLDKIKTKEDEEKYQRVLNYLVKEKGLSILNYLTKDEKTVYLEKYFLPAAKSAAEKEPLEFLAGYADTFKNSNPELIDAAAQNIIRGKEKVVEFLEKFHERYWARSYLIDALKIAAEEQPVKLLSAYLDRSNNLKIAIFNRYYDVAAKNIANKDAGWFMHAIQAYRGIPFWAEPHLDEAAKITAEKDPVLLLDIVRGYDLLSYDINKENIFTAIKNLQENNPEEFLKFKNTWLFDFINREKEANIKVSNFKFKKIARLIMLEKALSSLNLNIESFKIKKLSSNKKVKSYGFAPQGVLFLSSNKVLVGDNHYDPIELSNDLHNQILKIGNKYGYYGEGTGIEDNRGVIQSKIYNDLMDNDAKYNGSWDDLIEVPDDEKYVYVATVFSNPNENKRVPDLLNKVKRNDTIFDLLSREINNHTQPGLNLNSGDIKRFLEEASEDDVDFIQLSKMKATEENLQKFINQGEDLMWPNNWEEYPYNAGKLARRETIIRDNWIINDAPPGIYFIGSGHLKDISKMSGKEIIDGRKI